MRGLSDRGAGSCRHGHRQATTAPRKDSYFSSRNTTRDHCFDASHLPLQGTPPEAPLHLPDPELPSSCPFAYAADRYLDVARLPNTARRAGRTGDFPICDHDHVTCGRIAASSSGLNDHAPDPVIIRSSMGRAKRSQEERGEQSTHPNSSSGLALGIGEKPIR